MDSQELALELDVHQAQQKLSANESLLLLDCREPFEAEICQLPDSLLIPIQQTVSRVDELEPYRETPIIVYCHHGIRSLQVAHWLRGQGFLLAQSMTGGIDAWSRQIDPSVPTY